MIAHVNGVDLFYEKTGSGRPLLMVHGNGEDHRIFDEAAELLQKDFCCYCVDSRGHGQSGRVPELHYEEMARDMIALMEALDLRDVVFYGFSDGGIVGLLTAARCERVTALIVSGANVSPWGVKLPLRLTLRVMYLFTKDTKLALMLNEPLISDDVLHGIRARTLVLAGSRDLIREEHTRHIAGVIPGAKLRILEGEDHGSYIVHKRRIGELIRAFVRQQDGGEP